MSLPYPGALAATYRMDLGAIQDSILTCSQTNYLIQADRIDDPFIQLSHREQHAIRARHYINQHPLPTTKEQFDFGTPRVTPFEATVLIQLKTEAFEKWKPNLYQQHLLETFEEELNQLHRCYICQLPFGGYCK